MGWKERKLVVTDRGRTPNIVFSAIIKIDFLAWGTLEIK